MSLQLFAWSKLHHTPAFKRACDLFCAQKHRHFHTLDRLKRSYDIVQTKLKYPYDAALDIAILGKDIVCDSSSSRRMRSADWIMSSFPDRKEDAEGAAEMVKSLGFRTFDHLNLHLVDLYDFHEDNDLLQLILSIEKEVCHHKGIGRLEFSSGMQSGIQDILKNLRRAKLKKMTSEEKDALQGICCGFSKAQSILISMQNGDIR